jgi:hypothetical protein
MYFSKSAILGAKNNFAGNATDKMFKSNFNAGSELL